MDSNEVKVNKADPSLVNQIFQSLKIICYNEENPRIVADSIDCARMRLLRVKAADKIDKEMIRKMRKLKGND